MLCIQCGTSLEAEARFCGSCGTPTQFVESGSGVAALEWGASPGTAAAADPARNVTPAAGPEQSPTAPAPELAGMGDRLIAVLLDTILFGAAFAWAGNWAARRWGGITSSGFSLHGTAAVVTIAIILLFAFLYHWLGEGFAGATLGKGILGIAVRSRDGRRLTLSQSLIRNLARAVDGLGVYLVGLFVALLSKLHQRIGDHLAKTIVVRRPVGRVIRAALIALWIGSIAAGFWEAHRIHRSTTPSMVSANAGMAREAASIFASAGDLKLIDFALLESKGGPLRSPAPYQPGNMVHAKYDVIGYSTDGEGRPKLNYDIVVLDPNGVPLNHPWRDEYTGRLESGTPVHGTFSFILPPAVPSGTCKLVIKVRDALKKAELELVSPIQVDAPPIAPATGFEVRDFRLSLSDGGPAVPVPEIEGEGSFYMNCKVFGLQFRGDEAGFRLALKVVGPGGKVLLDKPEFLSMHDSFFYRPATFHVPVSAHLNIGSGIDKGIYEAVYTFTDSIANSTLTQEAKFVVK